MVLGIVQARISSNRLPGKVLMPLLGRPMLWRQLERLEPVRGIDRTIVATSDQKDDTPLVEMCEEFGIECFCGSLDDVLDRFYRAAQQYKADHIVRLTGDCPLADPAVIDAIIDYHLSGGFEYTSNGVEPTFPNGLDAEVMKFEVLTTAWKEAKLRSQREHVTPFIWGQPERFNIAHYRHGTDLSHMRWTVDMKEDLEFVRRVFAELYENKPRFDMEDVLSLLERKPELLRINEGIERNEGYRLSLERDDREN